MEGFCMYGKVLSCALILAVAVALSGCSSPTVSPVATSDAAKQAAYSDYLAKSNATAPYQDVTGQAGRLIRDMDYSDVNGSLKAIGDMSSRLGGYVLACERSRVATEKYRAYVDRNSSEYSQLLAYDTSLGDDIMTAQGLNSTLAADRSMLNTYAGWQLKGDTLGSRLDEYKNFRYGDEMHAWLVQMRPQMEDLLSSGAQASDAIDGVMAGTPAGTGKDSLARMKAAISAKNDQLRQDFNALVVQYDATFGPVYGNVPGI